MSDIEAQIVKRVFYLPQWYMPNERETERLIDYVLSEDSERVARFARLLDCSVFSEKKKNDCFFCFFFFCGEIVPVAPKCCNSKMLVSRRECNF